MSTTRIDTQDLLDQQLATRILLLDGAMGTMIQQHGLAGKTTSEAACSTTTPAT